MSYEGYSQFLCKYGHYWTVDCNMIHHWEDEKCPYGHHAVWENMVNITNGSFDDDGKTRIDGFIELKEKSRRECSKCGTVTEIRYKIPKQKKGQ